ncbi:MAG: hypothetical protein ACXQS2_02465 [Methermicoccaceae archaeon]
MIEILGFGIEGAWRAAGIDYVAFIVGWAVGLLCLYQARTFVKNL